MPVTRGRYQHRTYRRLEEYVKLYEYTIASMLLLQPEYRCRWNRCVAQQLALTELRSCMCSISHFLLIKDQVHQSVKIMGITIAAKHNNFVSIFSLILHNLFVRYATIYHLGRLPQTTVYGAARDV